MNVEQAQGGLRPHAFCLPVLKRETHRAAVFAAATSGSPKFFLGTDSAPHPKSAKVRFDVICTVKRPYANVSSFQNMPICVSQESACGCAGIYSAPVALSLYAEAFESAGALEKLEAFACFNGPDFYGLPRNTRQIKLVRKPWTVPQWFEFGDSIVVPMYAGQEVQWQVDL